MEAIRSLRDAHKIHDGGYWSLLNTLLPFLLLIVGVRVLRALEVIPGWLSTGLTYFMFPFLTTAIVGACYSYYNESMETPPSVVGSLVYLPQGAVLLITTFLVSLIIALPILFAAGFLSFLGTPGIIILALFIITIASPLVFLDAEIVISEHGPISAIQGSFSFVRGNAFNVFLYFVVRFGLSFVGTLGLTFPTEATTLLSQLPYSLELSHLCPLLLQSLCLGSRME